MRKKIVKWITLSFVSASLLLSGCGQATMPAPELLESVAATDAYRPVEYGDVGDVDTVCGTVVPKDYCHFFTDNAKVEEIKVDIGEYVHKGDVIATADVELIQEEIQTLSDQRHLQDDLFEKDDELYLINKNKMGFLLQGAYIVQNMEAAKEIEESIKKLDENNRYERMLHDYKDQQLEKKMNKKRKLLEGTTLTADHDGYVTYIKDISESAQATKSENIVVISDFEDCSIEVSAASMSEEFIHTAKSYNQFFTIIEGKRYDLEKYEYSAEELVVIENKQMYPYMKFKAPEGCNLPASGLSVPVYRSVELVPDVLRIGCDSLFQDEKGTFVYVKKADAVNKEDREVRYVTIGKQTKQYAEVTSGLEEGELVYYNSSELLPATYKEVTLQDTDFTSVKSAHGYAMKKKIKSVCYSDYEGKVVTIEKDDNESVQKGDLVCTIQTEQAASSLMKMQNEIKNLNDDYDLNIKECEKQIEELNKQIADVVTRTNLSTSVVSYDQTDGAKDEMPMEEEQGQMIFPAADTHQQIQLELDVEQVRCEMKKMKIQLDYSIAQVKKSYEKAKKNNDGNGLISIYADTDGNLGGLKLEEGQNVHLKDRLFMITEEKSDRVLLISSDVLQVGQKVKLEQKKVDRTYEGHILALAKGDRVYVSQKDGQVYLTTNGQPDGKGSCYYVTVDNPEFYNEQIGFDLSYDESTLYGVFVVPVGTVRTEKIETNEYTYVWRLMDGNLVKQYVTKLDRKGADITTECIVAGIKSGDILAIESE